MSDGRPNTFIDLCLTGKASINDVDDFVDAWHGGAANAGLRECLGMSEHEYALWINDPTQLSQILGSRKMTVL